MSAEVLRWTLRRERRALAGWVVSLVVVVAVYVSFYPAMGDAGELQRLTDTLPEGLVTALGYDRIGTAAGYLESTIFGLLAPLLMLVQGIGAGARLLAGEEEAGSLELEASAPVARHRLVSARLAAVLVAVVVLGAAVVVSSLALVRAFELDVSMSALVGTGVGLVLLVAALSTVTFAVGAATGRRGIALAVGSGVATMSFVADALLALVDVPDWALRVSPFAWYLGTDPLVNGLDLAGALGLASLTVVAAVAAVVAFERRDLGV